MKYISAITLLILGTVLMALGIGARTIFAPPVEYTKTVSLPAGAKFVTVNAGELSKVKGKPELIVNSDKAVIALGRTIDVNGWLERQKSLAVTVADSDNALNLAEVAAAKPTEEHKAPPVTGNDMWLAEYKAEGGAIKANTDNLAANQTLLIAAGDSGELSGDLKVIWHRPLQTPLAGPFLVAGAVLTLAGVVLYLIFVDRDRRGLGPGRGRKGALLGIRDGLTRKHERDRRRARRAPFVAVGVGLAVATVLSGCAPSYWPQPAPKKQEKPVQPGAKSEVLSNAQLDRIIKDVSGVAATGDKEQSAEKLKARFAGDALRQREKNYTIRKKVSDYGVKIPAILPDRLNYDLVQSTETWPRIALVAVKSGVMGQNGQPTAGDKSPSLLLLLRQENPQQNYKVHDVFALRGGIQMPEAAPATEGTAVLRNDITTLRMQPTQVPAKYAAVLANGKDAKEAADFNIADDPVITHGGKAWVEAEKQRIANNQAKAGFSVETGVDDKSIVAVSTGSNGALVIATVNETRITKAEVGSELPVGNVVSALATLEGAQKEIKQTVQHQLLFFVPNKGSEAKILLLGSGSELIGAEGKK